MKVGVTSRSFSKNIFLKSELLKKYPDTKFNDDGKAFTRKTLIKFLSDCDKAITALETIDESVLGSLPNLKVISKYGVGLDMINFEAMSKFKVKLGWQGGVNKRSVSELTLAAMISLRHKSIFANQEVRDKRWYQVKGNLLSESTIGIIGCGHIGKDLVKLLEPFGCRILSYDILDFAEFYEEYNIEPLDLEAVLRLSDIVTLHLPLDDKTYNILSKERLSMMKEGSILINYARGGLVDEKALRQMLLNKKISGAALDVLTQEPPDSFKLASLDNVFITPHIGGSSEESIKKMGLAAIEGLDQAKDPLSFL